jgi:hypothetical protein
VIGCGFNGVQKHQHRAPDEHEEDLVRKTARHAKHHTQIVERAGEILSPKKHPQNNDH